MSKGIETYYSGRLFRSRLEAQWAAMFDLLGWENQWIYEPFDAAGYIPDFAITGARSLLVEIKPALSLDELEAPTARVMDALAPWQRDVLFLGASPALPASDYCAPFGLGHAGLLAEFMNAPGDPFLLSHALWATCTYCNSASVYHEELSYACRPCGHHDGDSYLGAAPDVRAMWNLAGNKVRWEGQR